MSRYRNRNIRGKFHTVSPKQTADSGFGELSKQKKGAGWSALSSWSSSDIDIIDDDGNCNTESSISGAEDYNLHEIHSTELVKEEYERMERVLNRLEPIPLNYDKDEYKLWIKTFPFLSLTGQSKLSAKSSQNLEASPAEESHVICDKTTSLSRPHKPSVIDNLLGELYPHSSTTYSNKELAQNTTLNPRTLDIEFDSFLQITPVSFPRQPSRSSRMSSGFSARRKTDFVVLPPIENLDRSISASSRRTRTRIGGGDVPKVPQVPENGELAIDSRSLNYSRSQRKRSRFVTLNRQ